MLLGETFLPPTDRKVNMNTPNYINHVIQQEIEENIEKYRGHGVEVIRERLQHLLEGKNSR